MPVPSFLTGFADKAQSVIQATPLAGHLPGHYPGPRPGSPDAALQPSANEAAAQGSQGGVKSHALEAIQYQLRTLGQQYGSGVSPIQRIITAEKGVSIDFDSVSHDSKSQSKELYTWGQAESEDLKDVTDRLAYLNFVQGSLAASLSAKLDAARAPLKALRDAETALGPRRNVRSGLHSQLSRIEHDQQRGMERKVAELKDQIRKAEVDDLPQEKEIELLKRKAIRESETLKWEAIREYGEKLVLLSHASAPIIAALPTLPPTPTSPYTGAQATGAARASLQRALDHYKTGHINLPSQAPGANLNRSDTVSFGESHATELSGIDSDHTHAKIPATPPAATKPLASGSPHSPAKPGTPGPINPLALNNSPAPIPHVSSTSPPQSSAPTPLGPAVVAAGSASHTPPIPTVAETGNPVVAGEDGPGPASGSLHDIKASSNPTLSPAAGIPPAVKPTPQAVPTPQPTPAPKPEPQHTPQSQSTATSQPPRPSVLGGVSILGGASALATPPSASHPSAEEEKRRLAALYSQAAPPGGATSASATSSQAGGSSVPKYESAEEEKKRLEREERERILRGDPHYDNFKKDKDHDDDLPPSYQEI
ncbi:hypothetical protein BDN72DRAFT_866840 [Pluteus cervinus]|uniref:Uncharacterized protein n=1 Tax=Pluteus cervinus TaxID=181527 RepID=A0ACD3BGM5_9AGAR|nr:hypothetical protein BDN72DRAFT_866840 [Pluteus cervinus]